MELTGTSISISGLRLYGYHGVMEQERRVGNIFALDMVLDYDAKSAMQSDDIARAVNYAEVVATVSRVFAEPSLLLEHVAARIIEAVMNEFPAVVSGKIRITKLQPPIPAELGGVSFEASWKR